MKPKPIINVVFLRNIFAEVNRGIYQRILCLSNEYRVKLFTLHEVFIDPQLAAKIEVIKFPFNIGKLQKFFFTIWFLLNLKKDTLPRRYQVVYTTNHQHYVMGYLAKNIFRTKWVIDFFHSPFHRIHIIKDLKHFPLIFYDKILIKIFQKILTNVDLAIVMAHTNTEGFARLLNKEFNVPLDKIVAVPDGVDIAYVKEAVRDGRKASSPNNIVRLIHVGTINSKKFLWGLGFLSKLKREVPNLKLVMIGDKPSDKFSKNQIESWLDNNKNWVEFHGRVEHKQALQEISKCDIGLCILDCSVVDYNFCHPVKIFEYMVLQKAIIAPNLEGIRGIIKDDENGLLYNCNDGTDFSEKLTYLVKNKEERIKMGERAGKDVIHFNWKELNKKVIIAFQGLY
jgi:glycosyltransferase involved in cell wall biosynthesis